MTLKYRKTLYNEIYNFSSNIIREIKSRRISSVKQTAYMEDIRNAHKALMEKSQSESPLGTVEYVR